MGYWPGTCPWGTGTYGVGTWGGVLGSQLIDLSSEETIEFSTEGAIGFAVPITSSISIAFSTSGILSVIDSSMLRRFENAIWKWFSEATGLETTWENQSSPQPSYPFATLRIIDGPTPIALCWREERTDQASSILIDRKIEARISVSCQVFVSLPDARDPTKKPIKYLIDALEALETTDVRDALFFQDIGLAGRGKIMNLDSVISDRFVSRATLDVTFRVLLEASEEIGYIATVQLVAPSLGIDASVPVGGA